MKSSLPTSIPPRSVGVGLARPVIAATLAMLSPGAWATEPLDFNRDIRPILSQNCFQCHGPDAGEKKGGKKALRLDLAESATARRGDTTAIVPGHPDQSALVHRILSKDPGDQMPPPESGKSLKPSDIQLLRTWIQQGAPYSRHWSYILPTRPEIPVVQDRNWPRNPIDHFILSQLERKQLRPNPEADAMALQRRVALDLTGLPPSLEDAERFSQDHQPGAYERMVDHTLGLQSYGEHWARLWLDQARYADSSGYADDPARTIWAFRDYVIRSFNANKPFDVFTVEQIAGDLLPHPEDDQVIATAFHRNTMTNNEGGTSDEEFRNVALVDRVNTTMAVWMGTTFSCAQCHNHKYDPISQEDYFRLFAILNNTADADRGDEAPIEPVFTEAQKLQKADWQKEITRLESILGQWTPDLESDRITWEKPFLQPLSWQTWKPSQVISQAGATVESLEGGGVRVGRKGKTDTYTVELPGRDNHPITGLRVEVLPEDRPPGGGVGHAGGNFVLTQVQAKIVPSKPQAPQARFLRIELPGKEKILSLAEVQVFQGDRNVAMSGEAKQSSTAYDGPARLAIDGNTDGNFAGAHSTTHTETSTDPWWELDLKSNTTVDRLVLWNRTDGAQERLSQFRIVLLDEKRNPLWERMVANHPAPQAEFRPDGSRMVNFQYASADYSAQQFGAELVLKNPDPAKRGWSVAPRLGERHTLMLVPAEPFTIEPKSKLVLTLEQQSQHEHATLGAFQITQTSDPRAESFARVPAPVLTALSRPDSIRTLEEKKTIADYFLTIAPRRQGERDQLAGLQRKLSEIRPYTTVPVLRELAGPQRRKTQVQLRGNYLNLGHEVVEGLPEALNSALQATRPSRLDLARWLVDRKNPLTARVLANRLWESIFGIGLVRTSEEFGSQGELPSHPELLDWLAVELMDSGWDLKHMLRLMVTSSTYHQSSKVTPEMAVQDPENRLLARGPRFRLSAEMIRDQALAVSGLLSPKMYGPPVKPVQPRMGLSAAFGSGTDWETSQGEDRFRRGVYTTWRRSNPYPSMATFDAPNREVCLVRRDRSNTPLQALVTLNDPVYIEAAQALARRMVGAGGSPADKVRMGFRLCLNRQPSEQELQGLIALHGKTRERFQSEPAKALQMATEPLGKLPEGLDPVEAAAWTVVGNVLLNLDEFLMKR